MLVDRERELAELNDLLTMPAARLVAVTGRRRLGKTTLLLHWAQTSGHPYLYWVASHFPSNVLLRQFSQLVWQHANTGSRAPRTFSYEDWPQALEELAKACQGDPSQGQARHIVIVDEFPYAVASEPGLPSALQNAWDHHLRSSNICMALCGSHVGMMEQLMDAHAPLYGRMVGPLQVRPLPFEAMAAFFAKYNAEQRVAVYAMLGGVPAYLEQFSDNLSLSANVRQHLFRETGLFRTDPDYLIGEQVRDLSSYQAVLSAIAGGARQPAEIALAAGLPQGSADPYLARLIEMDYVRRELPVTIPPAKRPGSRLSRYVLADQYLRFYFRFVRPNLDLLAQRLHDQVWDRISEQLRSFIGMTVFEELCQAWVLAQARANRLPLTVEQVGAHWGGGVQVDVAAVNWHEKALLLGEAKWGTEPVKRDVVRELIDKKTPLVLKTLPDAGEGWTAHYAFFARAGFTDAARNEAESIGGQVVDLERLDVDISAKGSL